MQSYTTRRCRCGAYTDYGMLCTKCTQTTIDNEEPEEEALVHHTIMVILENQQED